MELSVIPSLFGQGTPTRDLRGALDELSATQRTIAQRVADKLQSSSTSSFQGKLDESMAAKQDESLTRDMASMADTELRYEATSKLLEKSYADLRTAMTNNG
jgi:hypothetical protein